MELKVSNITKNFKDLKAVDGVSYTFNKGVYGLLGVNGAGKTTLMRMLCTLTKPDNGEISFDGNNIFSLDAEYRKILGYLPQDFGFYPEFTVWDYMGYISSIKGLHPSVGKQRSEELLKQVGMWRLKNKKMKKLSGGMKRRVGIAQAMLNDPKILILDEPTAGLDPSERIRFRNLISELSENRIVLLSTHIVSDVEYIAGQILLMKDGKIERSGTAEEIISSIPEKVWVLCTERENVDYYLKNYKVSNIKSTSDGAELRIISAEKPNDNATLVNITLEDVFLSYFGEKGESADV